MANTETGFAQRHIWQVLSGDPAYGTHLPGGIHNGVAPPGVVARHLVVAYVTGEDILSGSQGFIGAGMQYLLKVVDESPSDVAAQNALTWLDGVLMANNGSHVSGAYVYVDKRMPFHLPDVQDDIIWQQVGRIYAVFVDVQ